MPKKVSVLLAVLMLCILIIVLGQKATVQISQDGPSNDNPNYIIQVGSVFGFIISIDNII